MSINFSDVYAKTFEPIVDRGRVRRTIEAPDAVSYHNLGDRRYEILVKRHSAPRQEAHYVLVLGTVDDAGHNVYCALAILDSLHERSDSLSPFEMLDALLQVFGLDVRSEVTTGRLIYDETFWAETGDPAAVWTVQEKPERFFLGSWTTIETYGVSSRIESHFVFALDLDRYLAWLAPLGKSTRSARRRKRRR